MPAISVVIEGRTIRDVTDRRVTLQGADRLDLAGRTLMPGLIDAHVHRVASLANLGANALLRDALVALRAAKLMGEMLARGFTTVPDVGGATNGLRLAWQEGLVQGPRLSLSGKALLQTGGHGDFTGRSDPRDPAPVGRQLGAMGRVVDGVDAVRRACREELRAGADFIKVMANGGVASPTDPIAFLGRRPAGRPFPADAAAGRHHAGWAVDRPALDHDGFACAHASWSRVQTQSGLAKR